MDGRAASDTVFSKDQGHLAVIVDLTEAGGGNVIQGPAGDEEAHPDLLRLKAAKVLLETSSGSRRPKCSWRAGSSSGWMGRSQRRRPSGRGISSSSSLG